MATSVNEKTETVRIGHTPDMDDAFMFYGIVSGGTPTDGFTIEHVVEDIQTLNRRAVNAELDMTAISAASYPVLAKDYWIVSVGSSVGLGYGPLVISSNPCAPEELAGRRVAVPGLHTTACLLLRLAVPQVIPVEMPFEAIPEAVVRGEVHAGLVIHEWQLTYRDAGLLPVLDFGVWWQQQVKLPLPLGLNVVKKSLGRDRAQRISTIFRNSILYAFSHQTEAMAYAMQFGRGTDVARSRQFVSMYVNDESLTLTWPCQEALRILFDRGAKAGLIPPVPQLDIIEPTRQ